MEAMTKLLQPNILYALTNFADEIPNAITKSVRLDAYAFSI